MNWIRRTGLVALLVALMLIGSATSVFAATISEVVDDAAETGFHLDANVSISESDATEIVNAARNNGSRFYLIVLADTPLGGNTTYADNVIDDLGIDAGTVLVLSPDDVGWGSVDEGFSEADMEAAFQFASDRGGSDAEYAANFVIGLVGEDTTTAPVTTAAASSSSATSSSSGGGGGSGLIIFLVIIVGFGLLLFWLVRRGKKQTVNAAAEQLAKARMAIQKQVDAIANDILDMEDEVRVANNTEIAEYYNTAGETYRNLGERLQQADSPQELLEISNDLDVAIWQLDCAEALLDAKPKPPKPEPKRIEADEYTGRVTVPSPRPDYQRRPQRRSSYMGPGMMEILIGVAGQVLGGGAGRRSGGLGGLVGRRSTTSRASSSRSSGGGVVPGPGSPVSRRSSSTSSPRTPRKRSGGGRIRGGGKRRGR